MGKTTADIQREIEIQRELIERRMRSLEDRVTGDVRDAGTAVTHQVDERLHISEQAQKRPLATMMGAFGLGVVLGMLSDRGAGKREKQRQGQYPTYGARERENGLVSDLLGTASGFLSGTLGNELRSFFNDVLGEARSQRDGASGEPAETRFRARYDADSYENGRVAATNGR